MPLVPVSAEQAVTFPDPNLEAAIREAISKPTGDIYAGELAGLTELDASGRGIVDPTGLEYCVNLQVLDLMDNQIDDISPLTGLVNLYQVNLNNNRIDDVSPLAGLTNLGRLFLSANSISDVSALSSLTNLISLGLSLNSISDISSLSGLTNLWSLHLGANFITDVSPITSLINLGDLDLQVNQISDISPLVANTGFAAGDTIDLRGNPLNANAYDTYIPELLRRRVTLLFDAGVVTFSDANLEAFIREALNKPEGDIYSSELAGLTSLNIFQRNIIDLTGLEYCTNLEMLWLDFNQISDLSPLSGLTNLWFLTPSINQISDVSPLAEMTNLRYLALSMNQISDISPLAGLTNLLWLDLSVNQVSDIAPLVANTGLADGDTLVLDDNPLSAASFYTYIPELQGRGVRVSYGVRTISVIKANPALYAGATVALTGEYRGWKAGYGTPPLTRSDWVLQDASGSIYVSGSSLGLRYPSDVGKTITVQGTVMLKNGQPYIKVARSR
jgi:internalin A